jgi:SpoVK/Ycf46/Vps4 family AAA+-type ATPase
MNQSQDLALIIRSRVPLVVIESHEEHHVLDMIRRLSEQLRRPMYSWTVTHGVKCHDPTYRMQSPDPRTAEPAELLQHIRKIRSPGIFVLCDFHPYLENAPQIVRGIKEIALGYEYLGHTVLLVSARIELPDELSPFSARFELPMPDAAEIEQIIREEAARWTREHDGVKVVTHRSTLDRLTRALGGLPLTDARRLARNAIYNDGAITESDLPEINKAKFELLGMDGMLGFEYETESFGNVGGLRRLKQWLQQREPAFTGDPAAAGLDPPRGILLLGVQGSGKSLAAKATAGVWGVPLLRLDFGALYDKFFGESERNLRNALKTAEVMAPCVLWVDEIEKGLSIGDNEGGTSRRVLGALLTWMADRPAPVFLVATANDISSLPPELVRKGRLDEIFFVDLPTPEIRMEIFRIHLAKRDRDPGQFDLEKLSEAAAKFSGAEIEAAVVAGLYSAVARKESLSTDHLLTEIANTRPLSVVMAEQVDNLRRWAEARTVPAD